MDGAWNNTVSWLTGSSVETADNQTQEDDHMDASVRLGLELDGDDDSQVSLQYNIDSSFQLGTGSMINGDANIQLGGNNADVYSTTTEQSIVDNEDGANSNVEVVTTTYSVSGDVKCDVDTDSHSGNWSEDAGDHEAGSNVSVEVATTPYSVSGDIGECDINADAHAQYGIKYDTDIHAGEVINVDHDAGSDVNIEVTTTTYTVSGDIGECDMNPDAHDQYEIKYDTDVHSNEVSDVNHEAGSGFNVDVTTTTYTVSGDVAECDINPDVNAQYDIKYDTDVHSNEVIDVNHEAGSGFNVDVTTTTYTVSGEIGECDINPDVNAQYEIKYDTDNHSNEVIDVNHEAGSGFNVDVTTTTYTVSGEIGECDMKLDVKAGYEIKYDTDVHSNEVIDVNHEAGSDVNVDVTTTTYTVSGDVAECDINPDVHTQYKVEYDTDIHSNKFVDVSHDAGSDVNVEVTTTTYTVSGDIAECDKNPDVQGQYEIKCDTDFQAGEFVNVDNEAGSNVNVEVTTTTYTVSGDVPECDKNPDVHAQYEIKYDTDNHADEFVNVDHEAGSNVNVEVTTTTYTVSGDAVECAASDAQTVSVVKSDVHSDPEADVNYGLTSNVSVTTTTTTTYSVSGDVIECDTRCDTEANPEVDDGTDVHIEGSEYEEVTLDLFSEDEDFACDISFQKKTIEVITSDVKYDTSIGMITTSEEPIEGKAHFRLHKDVYPQPGKTYIIIHGYYN